MPGSIKIAFAYLNSSKTDVTTISFGNYQDSWNPQTVYGASRNGPFDTNQISTIIVWTDEDITSANRRVVWDDLETAATGKTISWNDSNVMPQ